MTGWSVRNNRVTGWGTKREGGFARRQNGATKGYIASVKETRRLRNYVPTLESHQRVLLINFLVTLEWTLILYACRPLRNTNASKDRGFLLWNSFSANALEVAQTWVPLWRQNVKRFPIGAPLFSKLTGAMRRHLEFLRNIFDTRKCFISWGKVFYQKRYGIERRNSRVYQEDAKVLTVFHGNYINQNYRSYRRGLTFLTNEFSLLFYLETTRKSIAFRWSYKLRSIGRRDLIVSRSNTYTIEYNRFIIRIQFCKHRNSIRT